MEQRLQICRGSFLQKKKDNGRKENLAIHSNMKALELHEEMRFQSRLEREKEEKKKTNGQYIQFNQWKTFANSWLVDEITHIIYLIHFIFFFLFTILLSFLTRYLFSFFL